MECSSIIGGFKLRRGRGSSKHAIYLGVYIRVQQNVPTNTDPIFVPSITDFMRACPSFKVA